MAQHVLIVCEACGSDKKTPGDTPGKRLLRQLQVLHQQWPRRAELDLETTGCLCVCDRPCAIAFVGTHKPSFLFGDLSPETSAEDLLIAAELYLDKADGMVPAYDLPLSLRSRRIARIPAAP